MSVIHGYLLTTHLYSTNNDAFFFFLTIKIKISLIFLVILAYLMELLKENLSFLPYSSLELNYLW
jgi:hypothetical protein